MFIRPLAIPLFIVLLLIILFLAACQAPLEPTVVAAPTQDRGAPASPTASRTPAPSLAATEPAIQLDMLTTTPSATPVVLMPVVTNSGTPTPAAPPRVLIFSKTAGFRHDSIADGIQAIQDLGSAHGFLVDQSEDAALFNDTTLAAYAAVIFLSTTGDVLNDAQEASFERYIQQGGGFVGVHAATDTEYDWPWYMGLVGTYFQDHPQIQPAAVDVVDSAHPSTAGLPARWERVDEWYNFQDDPSARVQVLLNLDETSYGGGSMGASHPLAWYQLYDGGRSWYTAMGHTGESFDEPLFLSHLLGGILWAAGEG